MIFPLTSAASWNLPLAGNNAGGDYVEKCFLCLKILLYTAILS